MPRSRSHASTPTPPSQPWACSTEATLEALGVVATEGLSPAEVRRRRARDGINALRQTERRGWASILVAQLRSLIVGLLAVGAALSLAFGQEVEGVSILVVIALNTVIGFVTELRAVRSMESLRTLGQRLTTVRREGVVARIPAQDLVVGDMVVLEGGDVITADLRLLEASRLQANEAALTGESLPVSKQVEDLPADTVLGDRACMLWKGTSITRGAGEGVVVGTGQRTELGRIAMLVEEAEEDDTPLEKRLAALGRRLMWASLAFVVAIAAVGLATGRELVAVLETAIALAVATVPEGLPIVATLALARGMWRMARRQALVEQLAAVETLGSTNVILTDKTGTLTENRMTVVAVVVDGGEREPGEPHEAVREVLRAATLCTDAALGPEGEAVGDAMEVALLRASAAAGEPVETLRERWPELRAEAFDPGLKMMATVHEGGRGGPWVAVKGAAEAVLAVCVAVREGDATRPLHEEERRAWLERAQTQGARGRRVLAIARRDGGSVDDPTYADLTLLGLVALEDPPRATIPDAIARCRAAGIRVVMVTGDHASTARSIARAVGILGPNDEDGVIEGRMLDDDPEAAAERIVAATVVARASPEQKLALLGLHRRAGHVVAMIGDGVNDAPALKQADIGVAMGLRGTEAAREAADMVLRDDDFGTITAAIEQGRVIFGNIRKFVVYLVSCNLGEILVVGLASLSGAPLPITPMQILFLNLVTDVFPALALGVGEGSSGIMEHPPREPGEPFLTRRHWWLIVGYSLLMALPVLGAMAIAHYALGLSSTRAVTVSFLVLALGQLVHVFNMADRGAHRSRNEVTRNPWVWGALALCVALVAVGLEVPVLARVLGVADPGPAGWAVALGLGLVPLVGGPIAKVTSWLRGQSSNGQ